MLLAGGAIPSLPSLRSCSIRKPEAAAILPPFIASLLADLSAKPASFVRVSPSISLSRTPPAPAAAAAAAWSNYEIPEVGRGPY